MYFTIHNYIVLFLYTINQPLLFFGNVEKNILIFTGIKNCIGLKLYVIPPTFTKR